MNGYLFALPLMIGITAEAAATAAASGACDHLPAVTAAAAEPNDNREPARALRDGVLSLRHEAREVAWYPEGRDGCALTVHAFAEEGGPARIPGPVIRVRLGTEVRATVRNTLPATIWVRGLQDRDTASLMPMAIEPGATHEFRFRATLPGTFYYWATRGVANGRVAAVVGEHRTRLRRLGTDARTMTGMGASACHCSVRGGDPRGKRPRHFAHCFISPSPRSTTWLLTRRNRPARGTAPRGPSCERRIRRVTRLQSAGGTRRCSR